VTYESGFNYDTNEYKMGTATILGVGRSMATRGCPASNVYKVKEANGNIFHLDENKIY
jgi:hypothetical protein